MAKAKFLGKRPVNTTKRLLELHNQADKDGDTETRDRLAAIIEEQGGAVPNGDIPKNETKLSRLERHHLQADKDGDTETRNRLAAMIAEEQAVESEIAVPETVQDAVEPAGDHCTRSVDGGLNDPEPGSDEWEVKYPFAACEATAGNCGRSNEDPLCENCENGDNYIAPAVVGSPELVNPTAVSPHEGRTLLNNGTASVNAAKRIAEYGYNIDEIPTKDGGKVDMFAVKAYRKMVGE